MWFGAAVAAAAGSPHLVAVGVLLFAAAATATVLGCSSMAAMGAMDMPGGWTLSMAWMRMPGRSWSAAAASFLGMWVVMMAAMMLPSLLPELLRYRRAAAAAGAGRPDGLAALAGMGYILVWAAVGMAVYPLGAGLAAIEMQWPAVARAVPVAAGVVALSAGLLQFSAWKARQLGYCRREACSGHVRHADAGAAWRFGLRLGVRCNYCCAGLTAMLLAVGVMDLRAMTMVSIAITAERLAPAGDRVARVIGALLVGGGLYLMERASGFR